MSKEFETLLREAFAGLGSYSKLANSWPHGLWICWVRLERG